MKKFMRFFILSALAVFVLAGCASYDFADNAGTFIVEAKDALAMVEAGDVILVDVRSTDDYATGHVEGAINIPATSVLVTKNDVPNMLADAETVAAVMSEVGVTADDALLVYDANNMYAARLLWTLNMYNNFNVQVVSGGIGALEDNDAVISTSATVLPEATYVAVDYQKTLISSLDYLQTLINNPDGKTVIIDARSAEEYAAGTIPGSINVSHLENEYATGELMITRDLQLRYLGKDITPDMKLVVFCKSGVRASEAYVALKDAGYPDVRVFDGSVLEYEAVYGPLLPASGASGVSSGDAS